MKFEKAFADTVNTIGAFLGRHREAPSPKPFRGSTEYAFTADYVSSLAPPWEKHLAEFKGRGNVRMLEVGSFEGRSCIWFLENILTHPASGITCVDVFQKEWDERFDHNIQVSGLSRKVIKRTGRSERILPLLKPASFDIIYVDGCHAAPNVMMDAAASWLLLKPGGVMIFDDYEWEPEKPPEDRPKPAIDLFLRLFQDRLDVLHKDYQVIIRRLRNHPGRGQRRVPATREESAKDHGKAAKNRRGTAGIFLPLL